MRQHGNTRTDLKHLQDSWKKNRDSHDPEPPFEGGTVVEPAWHILEYRPAEGRTYYLGTTRKKIEDPDLAYLSDEEFTRWLDSDDVTCELEK